MADLKVPGRQIAQPNAPDISHAGKAYEGIGKAVTGVAKTYAEFKQAAKETEAAVLYTDFSHALDKTALEFSTPEQIAQKGAYSRYQANSEAIISSIHDVLPGEMGKELANKLKAQANNNAIRILARENEFATQQNKSIIENSLDAAGRNYANAMADGNTEAIQAAREEKDRLYENAIKLGLKTENDKYAANLNYDEMGIKQRYFQRGINDALARPGAAEQQLEEFARTYPEDDHTNAQRVTAINAYLEGINHIQKQLNTQRAINAQTTANEIQNNTITLPTEIYGRDLTKLQGLQAEAKLYAHQNKQNKHNAKVNQFLNRVQQGSGLQNLNASEEVKEDAFAVLDEAARQIKVDQTGDLEATLTVEDQANVLRQADVNRPSYDAQIGYAMSKADVETQLPLIDWSLGMLRTVGKEKPNTIKISEKDRAIGNLANIQLQYGRTDPRAAIEAARATINVDEVTLKGRRTRQKSGEWFNDMKSAYKEMTGADYQTNPTSWGAFQAIYSTQAMLTDDPKAAAEGARQLMEPAFGKSKFFADDEYGYLPPEKIVPFADQGHWLESQINLKLIDIAEANHNAPLDQISNLSKVELGGDPKTAERLKLIANSELSESHLFDYRIGPTQQTQSGASIETPITYRVEGQDRQVVLQADSSSRTNEGSKLRYAVMTINPKTGQKNPVMDPRSRTGFATITIDSLEEFLPEVYQTNNNEMYDKATKDVILKRYKEQNSIPVLRAFGLSKAIKEQGPEVEKILRKNEKDYAKAEVLMENERGTLLTKSDIFKKINEGEQ